MPERLPLPGPSFLREQEFVVHDAALRAGMSRPSTTDDGWWLAVLWISDANGVVSFRTVAPASGPPPGSPLQRLGPAFAGSLSGMILEENNRLSIRLNVLVPPDDPVQPWRCPLAIRAGFRWEPMRAATMRPNEIADTVLTGFRRSVESLSRP